tara:strand:+ start:665 stop:934 length:270 start_codon:yes stop_codon:yes gene_type:complete
MGRVNNAFAYDKKRSRRMGKLYSTIDFNINEKISADLFARVPEKPIVGQLEIGGKSFDVTYQELDAIQTTLQEAKRAVEQRYRLNAMNK